MKTNDFDFQLPKELIAQKPLKKRDTSRLFCLSRDTGKIIHSIFRDLPKLLKPQDRLVFNNTKVFPARLYCLKETGAKVELLFTRKVDKRTWQALIKPARRLKQGAIVMLEKDKSVRLCVKDVLKDGSRVLSLVSAPFDSIEEIIDTYGEMPLPPYIRRRASDEDCSTYQTVYAEKRGAIAAPTAGLHFSDELLGRLAHWGVQFSFVTLHVGFGTFKPVKVADPQNHMMHVEEYDLNRKTIEEIQATQNNGGRVIAVGTTVVRVLEHGSDGDGSLQTGSGLTRLMILPGYKFKIVDGLITNFHLPRSTLLMLVSAFAGRESVLNAYEEAINKKYRFFSYGDAMLIL